MGPELNGILAGGASSMCDAELLRIVLSAPDERLPAEILAPGLAALRRVTAGSLLMSGASARNAAQLLAALELGRRVALSPSSERPRLLHAVDLAQLLWARLAHLQHEEFWCVLLTARLQEIRCVRISTGGLSQCSVTAREAFAPAMVLRAPAVAFAHNHPSGDSTPSAEDQRLQLLLDEAGRALGIRVVDHLVVGEQTVHSSVEGECVVVKGEGDGAA
jgi:DNA repair protein RadC